MEPNSVIDNNTDVNKSDLNSTSCSGIQDNLNIKTCEDGSSNSQETNETTAHCDDSDDDDLELDEEAIAENHKGLSELELEKLKEEATSLKNKGNLCFQNAKYLESSSLYTAALNICPLKYGSDRAILYSNRAAARRSLELNEEAVLDCNKAIELNPSYLKAVLRRAQLHRKMDSPEKALEDYKKILELDPNNSEARQACVTLPPEIEERNEKLKTEMFGKLKELGNLCLKPFGLSTENFQVVQDPNSGGYSINFQNNKD